MWYPALFSFHKTKQMCRIFNLYLLEVSLSFWTCGRTGADFNFCVTSEESSVCHIRNGAPPDLQISYGFDCGTDQKSEMPRTELKR